MKFKYTFFLLIFLGIAIILTGFNFLRIQEIRFFEKQYSQGNYQALNGFFEKKYFYSSAKGKHNLGNLSYYIFRSGNQDFLKESLLYFSGSLGIEFHDGTQQNYAYVASLLDSLSPSNGNQGNTESQEKQTNASQNTNTSPSGNDTEKNSQSGSSQESQKGNENTIQSQRGDNYKISEDETMPFLDEESQKQVEKYIQDMQKEQKDLQKFYGKQESNDAFESLMETMFSERIGGTQEKDW